MAMVAAKCTECGAAIKVDETKENGICEHCGTEYVTEKVINNIVTNHVHNITNNVTKIIYGKESDDGEDYFNRGLTNLKLDKYDVACDNFKEAIEKNPEVAKYYFYWSYAKSVKLKVAYDFMNGAYDNKEPTIKTFMKLATKEEKEKFSREFDIDLMQGYNNLFDLLAIRNQNQGLDTLLKKGYYGSVVDAFKNVYAKMSKETIIKLVPAFNKWYDSVLLNGSYDDEIIAELTRFCVEKNLHPRSKEFKMLNADYDKLYLRLAKGASIKELEELKIKLDERSSIKKERIQAQEKANKNAEIESVVDRRLSRLQWGTFITPFVLGILAFLLMVSFGENTQGFDLLKSLGVGFVVLVVSFALLYFIYSCKRKKTRKQVMKEKGITSEKKN